MRQEDLRIGRVRLEGDGLAQEPFGAERSPTRTRRRRCPAPIAPPRARVDRQRTTRGVAGTGKVLRRGPDDGRHPFVGRRQAGPRIGVVRVQRERGLKRLHRALQVRRRRPHDVDAPAEARLVRGGAARARSRQPAPRVGPHVRRELLDDPGHDDVLDGEDGRRIGIHRRAPERPIVPHRQQLARWRGPGRCPVAGSP